MYFSYWKNNIDSSRKQHGAHCKLILLYDFQFYFMYKNVKSNQTYKQHGFDSFMIFIFTIVSYYN